MSFFFFILSVYVIWIFLLRCCHVLDCFSNWGIYISFFHIFSDILGLNRSLRWICVIYVCGEAKVIVKINAVLFFIVFKPDYRDLIYVDYKCFVVVTIDKAAKNFAFICKIYCISKLLAELDLSNSKSKTYSKATHSIEEIIQTNMRNSKNFDLNIPKLDKSLPIMYCLPKIPKILVGARFTLASYYCSTNPLSGTISKIFKMIFNTVENFYEKDGYFQMDILKH